jgi:hypothetical protein
MTTSESIGHIQDDPSRLATAQLVREIEHLRELMESAIRQVSQHSNSSNTQSNLRLTSQLEDIRRQMEAKFEEQDRAVQAALSAADKAVDALEKATAQRLVSLQELNDNKFITYRTLLDSQADKVAIALTASDKAVAAAFDSSKEAIGKAEAFNEKRFDILTEAVSEIRSTRQGFITRSEFDTLRTSTSEKIDDLKTYRDTTQGNNQGKTNLVGWIFGGLGAVATLITIVVVIVNLATSH